MQNSSNEILNNSLRELKKKRDECSQELRNYELAITRLEGILIDISEGDNVSISGRIIPEKKQRRIHAKKRVRKTPHKITEEQVRDAIIELTKNPPKQFSGGKQHERIDGFFTSSHITDIISCSRSNPRINLILKKFVSKGVLESAVYKNGFQYKYIPVSEANIEKLPPKISSGGISGGSIKKSIPIPGTGQSKVRTQDKDVTKLIQQAKAQGYRTEVRGSGHIFVTDDNGKSTTISATGNSSHHRDNVARDLINIGVKI